MLSRLLGPVTAFLIGLGVAIGSGIFRTPGEIAGALGSPGFIILAWVFGGLFVLASSMVSAELATRFPKAGGEYVYLKEAYGDFPAFFFGWGYTVFIIGGGAAVIATALGEAVGELAGLDASLVAVAAIIVVTGINAVGLKAGAGLQNGLTVSKILVLLGFAAAAFFFGEAPTQWDAPIAVVDRPAAIAFLAALPPVLWTYEGTTDAVKMAEEIKDVQRGLPRALIGSALTLTVLYVTVNLACMAALTPAEMAQHKFVPNAAMQKMFGDVGYRLMVVAAVVVLAGSLSSTTLATVRVTFALARDGFAPRQLAQMSNSQSPVIALVTGGAIASVFCLFRGFTQILGIYFLAAAILFGLAYASLIVFRMRDTTFPKGVFRCPAGVPVAVLLIVVQLAMGVLIVVENPTDSLYTFALLASFAVVYVLWRRMSANS